MSWLFSQALVAASSADICLGGAACALWSATPTPRASWLPDKMTAACRLSRSGMTYAPLTDGHGAALLTWCLAASRARTSPAPERARGSTESGAGCGGKWRASLARWDRDSCSWKTHQYSLLGGLESFSETWPRWGMMRAGECWERQMPSGVREIRARITSAKESGFLRCPTPRAADAERFGTAPKDSWNRSMASNLLRDWIQRFPTPDVHSWKSGPRGNGTGGTEMLSNTLVMEMARAQRFPTPLAQDAKHHPDNWPARMASNQFGLTDVVGQLESAQRFATPQARDFRTGEASRWGNPERSRNLNDQVGGSLNPTWVEWLMGWPLGWTALEPLAMARFRQWCGWPWKSSAREVKSHE